MMQLSSKIIRHNFNPQASLVGEKRLIFSAHPEAHGAAHGAVAAAGDKLAWLGKYSKNIASVAMLPYKPLIWPSQIVWGLMKKGIKFGHTTFHVGKEAASAVALTGVGKTALELGSAPLKDIKINAWDFPIALGKGALEMGKGILSAPLNLARGIRKSVSTLLTTPIEASRQLIGGEIIKSIATIRSGIYDTLTNPFVMPLKPILAAPLPAAEQLLRSKVQYGHAYMQSFKHMREGAQKLINAPKQGMMNAEKARDEFFAKRAAAAHEKHDTHPTEEHKEGKKEKGGDHH